MLDPEKWFVEWFYRREGWERRIPMSDFMRVPVFMEALRDYDKEIRSELEACRSKEGNAGATTE